MHLLFLLNKCTALVANWNNKNIKKICLIQLTNMRITSKVKWKVIEMATTVARETMWVYWGTNYSNSMSVYFYYSISSIPKFEENGLAWDDLPILYRR